jgi:hypothetical protein
VSNVGSRCDMGLPAHTPYPFRVFSRVSRAPFLRQREDTYSLLCICSSSAGFQRRPLDEWPVASLQSETGKNIPIRNFYFAANPCDQEELLQRT